MTVIINNEHNMEFTYGNSPASKYLEDLVSKNESDKRTVSRLLSSTFKIMKGIQDNNDFRYLSQLIVDDFIKKVEESKHEYSNPAIKDLMKNLIITKRKVLLHEKFPEDMGMSRK